jgi:hypothetical protein
MPYNIVIFSKRAFRTACAEQDFALGEMQPQIALLARFLVAALVEAKEAPADTPQSRRFSLL